MPEYLVSIMYHDPESFALWNRGVIEDYESNAGLFIMANTPGEAIAWGEQVGEELLRFVCSDPTLDWHSFDYVCRIENAADGGSWSHCLDFFQHVRAGERPVFDRMTSDADRRWEEQNQKERTAANKAAKPDQQQE